MITQTGRVVAVAPDCLWVETIQQSTCGGCSVKKGCGHALLNNMGATRHNHLRVLLTDHSPDDFAVNDEVSIGIAERVLVRAAFLVYLLPLLGLLAGAMLVSLWWQNDVAAFIGAVIGFVAGIAVVKLHAIITYNNADVQPVVLSHHRVATRSSAPVVVNIH